MASLVVRNLGPLQYEPAHAAQQIVMWYAGRLWTLRVLLFALPCLALASGCWVLRTQQPDTEPHGTRPSRASILPHWMARIVAVTTVASAGILVIVGFHVITH